jgi:uncharacterized protein YneF (UPF0154 family)
MSTAAVIAVSNCHRLVIGHVGLSLALGLLLLVLLVAFTCLGFLLLLVFDDALLDSPVCQPESIHLMYEFTAVPQLGK